MLYNRWFGSEAVPEPEQGSPCAPPTCSTTSGSAVATSRGDPGPTATGGRLLHCRPLSAAQGPAPVGWLCGGRYLTVNLRPWLAAGRRRSVSPLLKRADVPWGYGKVGVTLQYGNVLHHMPRIRMCKHVFCGAWCELTYCAVGVGEGRDPTGAAGGLLDAVLRAIVRVQLWGAAIWENQMRRREASLVRIKQSLD